MSLEDTPPEAKPNLRESLRVSVPHHIDGWPFELVMTVQPILPTPDGSYFPVDPTWSAAPEEQP